MNPWDLDQKRHILNIKKVSAGRLFTLNELEHLHKKKLISLELYSLSKQRCTLHGEKLPIN